MSDLESGEESDLLKLEYEQASQTFRQIDVRIWSIYALYVAISGGAFAVGFDPALEIEGLKLVVLAASVILMTVAKMGLVGHLQWSSDILADRLRCIERKLGTIKLNQLFLEEKRPCPSKLDYFHKWLCSFRARELMQGLAFLVMVFWICYPCYKIFLSKECREWIHSYVELWTLLVFLAVISIVARLYMCGRSRMNKLGRQRSCERTGTPGSELER